MLLWRDALPAGFGLVVEKGAGESGVGQHGADHGRVLGIAVGAILVGNDLRISMALEAVRQE